MAFWDPTAGSQFLDGSSAVGSTASDQPTNGQATNDAPNYYLICDRTGFRQSVKKGLKKEWTGSLIRTESWEPRHPQDFVRAIPEKQRGSPRPEPADYFVSTNEVTTASL